MIVRNNQLQSKTIWTIYSSNFTIVLDFRFDFRFLLAGHQWHKIDQNWPNDFKPSNKIPNSIDAQNACHNPTKSSEDFPQTQDDSHTKPKNFLISKWNR